MTLSERLALIMDCDLDSLSSDELDDKMRQIEALRKENLQEMIATCMMLEVLGDAMDDMLGWPRIPDEERVASLLSLSPPDVSGKQKED